MNQEPRTGNQGRIRSFTDLTAWKEAHQLVLSIYKITGSFPKEELFGLVSQMRRCAISIVSNIAEGFSRRYRKEKLQFYAIALGSLTELQAQLLVARDVGYMSKDVLSELADQVILVQKLLRGLVRGAKNTNFP